MMKPGGVMVSSSPGREKLPTPPGLAHLLSRKAGGSRSRGRSAASAAARSSPMFVSRSRSRGRASSAAAAAAEEGEPSSPKVTCIGQVRIRSKRLAKPKKPKSKKARSRSSLMPCRCLHKALFCRLFTVRKRPTGGGSSGGGGGVRRSLWRSWARIRSGGSGGGYRQRKPDPIRPPPLSELVRDRKVSDREEEGDNTHEEEEEEEAAAREEEAADFMPAATTTPPKNALLLMRCRSAPHNRASSLATARFAVSPLPAPEIPPAEEHPEEEEEVPGVKARDEDEQQQQHQEEERRRSSGGAAQVGDAEAGAGAEEDVEARGSESQRPLVLPRSKSEPARRASTKMSVPEVYCFWTSNSSGGRRHRSGTCHEEGNPHYPPTDV